MQLIKTFFLAMIMGSNFLYSGTDATNLSVPALTPQQEFEALQACAANPKEPLSLALKKLAAGIVPKELLELWVQKFAALEAQKFDGEYVEHWDNGQVKFKATFKQGKVDGHVHGWYSDGCDAFKMFFEEEKKIGIHMAFFSLEPKRVRNEYGRLLTYDWDGKLDGEQKACYSSGDLKVIARYRNGLLNGNLGFYDIDGKNEKKYQYKEGKLVTDLTK